MMGIKFRYVRMQVSAPPRAACGSEWDNLKLTLFRIYEGEARPSNLHVTRQMAQTIAIWHILKGQAEVEYLDRREIAMPGQWMICLPGEREQRFANGTHLLSLHLRVESPANSARWVGPHLHVFESNDALRKAANQVREAAETWGLCRTDYVFAETPPLSLSAELEIRAASCLLLRAILPLLAERNVSFEPASSSDMRVADGIRWLAGQSLRKTPSRNELARLAGLSPSQLDRIWRKETGQTPIQQWERKRLRHALNALNDGRLLIKEIAFDLGFTHVSQFSTWFRIHQGESPRAFRNRPRSV